jgi:hypothetical protein
VFSTRRPIVTPQRSFRVQLTKMHFGDVQDSLPRDILLYPLGAEHLSLRRTADNLKNLKAQAQIVRRDTQVERFHVMEKN